MHKYFLIITLFVAALASAADKGTESKNPDCGPDAHWVRAHTQRPYVRTDGTPVRGSYRYAHCQNNPESYAIWKDRLKNDRPANWPDANLKEKSKKWTDEEIERVLEALNDVPKILWADSIKFVTRMDKSIYKGNSASGTPGYIVLYDEAFGVKNNLSRILTHELAHEYYRSKVPEKMKKTYMDNADWYDFSVPGRSGEDWRPIRNNTVTENSDVAPEEDFANHVEYYIFESAKLKSTSPKVHSWMQHNFGDKLKLNKR